MKVSAFLMTVVAIMLLAIAGLWLTPQEFVDGQGTQQWVVASEDVIDEPVTAVSCYWGGSDVLVSRSEDDAIHIVDWMPLNKEADAVPEPTFSPDGNTLIIGEGLLVEGSTNVTRYDRLEVQLPARSFESLHVMLSIGALHMDDAAAEELLVTVDTGGLNVEGSFDHVTVVGKEGVELDLTCTTMLQTLSVEGEQVDVTLRLPENAGFTLRHTLLEDALDSDFALKNLDETTAVYGDGSAQLDLHSAIDSSLTLRQN